MAGYKLSWLPECAIEKLITVMHGSKFDKMHASKSDRETKI